MTDYRPVSPSITYTAQTRIIRDRFDAGLCPCCGGDLHASGGVSPIGLNEDICGQCARYGHCQRPGSERELGAAVVAAIAARNDGAVAGLLPGSYLPCSFPAEAVTSG